MSRDEKFENDIIDRYISPRCRRSILSQYLDGLESTCTKNDEKCDICKSIYLDKLLLAIYYILIFIGLDKYHLNSEESETSIENDSNKS